MVRQVRSDKTVGKLEESAGLPNGPSGTRMAKTHGLTNCLEPSEKNKASENHKTGEPSMVQASR